MAIKRFLIAVINIIMKKVKGVYRHIIKFGSLYYINALFAIQKNDKN